MNTIGFLCFLQTIFSIPVPPGFHRVEADGFAEYLRKIKLKEDNIVYLYNGQKKRNQNAQYAVLDISVGPADLQQCADAAMRLRAEYLFRSGQYGKIVFKSVNGNSISFRKPFDYWHLMKHMDVVYGSCNSWSLERDLIPKKLKEVRPGDLLIKGGFPGHVVIVVDVAINKAGEKLFMIAQSYMPAQDIHVLKGPVGGVWYPVSEGQIVTPEWVFRSDQLKSW